MYAQIAKNKRNTIFIILGFVLFITALGLLFSYLYHDWKITAILFVIASVYAFVQYFFASRILILATGAKPIEKKDQRRLYNIVENLSIAASIPVPKIYIIEDSAPNAFASGTTPKSAFVAATTGLLDLMDDRELKAVMAHEISHIKNYDIRVSLIVFALTVVVGVIADLGVRFFFYRDRDDDNTSPVGFLIMILVSILAPLIATIARLAVSRQREYLADVSAVKLTRYPDGMISALKKLGTHGRPMRRQNSAAASMFIYNPMKKSLITNLFSTHPPIENRIEALEHAKKTF